MVTKYGELVWNQSLERTDLYLDADLLKAAIGITEILANLGDFQARTNLRTLLATLGVPDVAAKSLYTLLITDRLDHGTYGLSALYNALAGTVNAVNRAAGKEQMRATTTDLQQAAASYTLFTGTTQDVVIESLLIRLPAVNVSDDATITSISIQTNDATPQVFVNSVIGAKVYLTSEAQLGWTGSALLKTGKLIQLTIAGGAADAATVCDVIVKCRAVVSGGYLV